MKIQLGLLGVCLVGGLALASSPLPSGTLLSSSELNEISGGFSFDFGLSNSEGPIWDGLFLNFPNEESWSTYFHLSLGENIGSEPPSVWAL